MVKKIDKRWRSRTDADSDGCVRAQFGYEDKNGRWYTKAIIDGRSVTVTVQRLAWLNHFGPLVPGQVVYSSCFNRWCIEASHLRAGSPKQMHAESVASLERWGCGHERTQANTIGHNCRQCQAKRSRKAYDERDARQIERCTFMLTFVSAQYGDVESWAYAQCVSVAGHTELHRIDVRGRVRS